MSGGERRPLWLVCETTRNVGRMSGICPEAVIPVAHVNGIDLFHQVEGEGEPLLLLAGFACDHTHWAMVKSALVNRYRVILPDNRGVGRSDAPDNQYSMRQMVDDIAGLLDYLEVEQTHVAGHSMGGQIAQEFVLANPARVRRLMLTSTWAAPDTLFGSVIQSWGELPRVTDPRIRSFVWVILPWVFTDSFFETPGAVSEAISLWTANPFPPSSKGLYHQSRAILASNTTARIPGMPT